MSRTVEQIQFAPRMPKPLRVAAYARVSSGKDAMLHSLAAQVDHYSTYIRHHHGWEYVGVYADEAKTGTRDSRENFQRMLTDCRAGKIDHIITKSISRFSRNTVTLLETVRELKELGISVYFEEQSIDTATADGELMLSILASYAQEESLSASENQKWRVKRNFEEGIPWRFFMLGYRRENGKLAIVPEEAEIVRSIFDDYLAGKGVTAIAKRLNESGYATQSGCVFHKSAVERILRNYAYTGNLLLQTKFRENHLTKVTRKNQGELPRYHATDTHEAIIPPETFNAVQAEIRRRKEKYAPTKPQQPSPFTGLVTCAICGKHYCKEHGIRLSGPALGRPKKGETRDEAQDYRDECERVEVERRFSLAKRKCGMGLVTAKLRETAAHVIAMSVLVLNLRKIQCAIWYLLMYLLAILPPKKKLAIVQ